MKSYTMLIDETVVEKIEAIASKEERSAAYIIRKIIADYLARQEGSKIKEKKQ